METKKIRAEGKDGLDIYSSSGPDGNLRITWAIPFLVPYL